ncbi:unnamed protein product [Calypogeia fissa]
MAPSALPPPDPGPTTNIAAPAAGVRRKTPSELRQEQLNRAVRPRNSQNGTSNGLPPIGSTADLQKKTYLRLVDTYAATKPHDRSKFPLPKQKDDVNKALPNGSLEPHPICRKPMEEELCSLATAKEVVPAHDVNSEAPENQSERFRDVTQLASKTKPQAPGLALDMAQALKVMAPAAGRALGGMTAASGIPSQLADSSSLVIIPLSDKLKMPPIDLSLKLSSRFLSIDSLQWCHRISSANEVEGVKLFVEQSKWIDNVDIGSQSDVVSDKGRLERFGARFWQALHSWVHPSPQYLELYEMVLAGGRGDIKKLEMITALFRTWEDSFQSLYNMFLYKYCNVFYVCTQQSVVMFERGKNAKVDQNRSHVYWSRSTRGLRKKLQEQGIEFLMPFCSVDGDMSTLEDLQELTEFEKLNPGQTRLVDSRAAIDNNAQSLLLFEDGNVHRVFDFLLNYRFLVASGNATDFPVLYSPVAFSKAALYTPEVKCRRVQCPTENISKEPPIENGGNGKVSEMLYSLELKCHPGGYITPWVIDAVCSVLQKSQKLGFDASFVTGPLSETLNVAQDTLSSPGDTNHDADGEAFKASSSRRTYTGDISRSKMKVVKNLRYRDGLYQANFGDRS